MTRVKRGYVARKRRERTAHIVQGCKRALSRLSRSVQQQAIKTLTYSQRDRNRRKRAFRHLWIVRVNAAARQQGINYSRLAHALYNKRVSLNRKMLAQIAVFDNSAWRAILAAITTESP